MWCRAGHIECIRLLLDHGADGTIRMTMGWTPAHCSCEAGKLAALRALHAYGVPLDRRDKYGDTPRRIAQIYGHADCVSFIDKCVRLAVLVGLTGGGSFAHRFQCINSIAFACRFKNCFEVFLTSIHCLAKWTIGLHT